MLVIQIASTLLCCNEWQWWLNPILYFGRRERRVALVHRSDLEWNLIVVMWFFFFCEGQMLYIEKKRKWVYRSCGLPSRTWPFVFLMWTVFSVTLFVIFSFCHLCKRNCWLLCGFYYMVTTLGGKIAKILWQVFGADSFFNWQVSSALSVILYT